MEGEAIPSSTADTVYYRVCNNTGANADPPRLQFHFWTIKQ